jgi:predicted nucleic-acid-binding Zn-ribbon protein
MKQVVTSDLMTTEQIRDALKGIATACGYERLFDFLHEEWRAGICTSCGYIRFSFKDEPEGHTLPVECAKCCEQAFTTALHALDLL